MYFEVPFTDELRKRIERRRDHFVSEEWTWKRNNKASLFYPARPYPFQRALDFYIRIAGGDDIVTAIPKSVKRIFVTPEEYHELFCTVYGFEIAANSISASKLTVDKLKPTTADFGMDGV